VPGRPSAAGRGGRRRKPTNAATLLIPVENITSFWNSVLFATLTGPPRPSMGNAGQRPEAIVMARVHTLWIPLLLIDRVLQPSLSMAPWGPSSVRNTAPSSVAIREGRGRRGCAASTGSGHGPGHGCVERVVEVVFEAEGEDRAAHEVNDHGRRASRGMEVSVMVPESPHEPSG